jgi:myo-inositol-1(or 4)-monophosphatase
MPAAQALPEADWLGFCRRAAEAARAALRRFPTAAERAVVGRRGAGGDMTLVIDRAAEDAVFAELDSLGQPVTAISEERGEVELRGGGPVRVVIDPVDGSINAKRGIPFASVSIAVAAGPRMSDVEIGYVAELDHEVEWWAVRGEGAYRQGERLARLEPGPLELLGLETAHPEAVAESAAGIAGLGAERVRAVGSVALTLCLVAAGRLDAMVSLRNVRSVDAAAGQLMVLEAGGSVRFPQDDSLSLRMRSPVAAARDAELLERVLGAVASD